MPDPATGGPSDAGDAAVEATGAAVDAAETTPPFDPDPGLVAHLEGSERSRAGYLAAAEAARPEDPGRDDAGRARTEPPARRFGFRRARRAPRAPR